MNDFFFNDTATTEIYTLSLHDALPICCKCRREGLSSLWFGSMRNTTRTWSSSISIRRTRVRMMSRWLAQSARSEEHTSELQSRQYLVCRLLLEKKKNHEIARANY